MVACCRYRSSHWLAAHTKARARKKRASSTRRSPAPSATSSSPDVRNYQRRRTRRRASQFAGQLAHPESGRRPASIACGPRGRYPAAQDRRNNDADDLFRDPLLPAVPGGLPLPQVLRLQPADHRDVRLRHDACMPAVGKLHEQFPDAPPTADEARSLGEGLFHLKHVPQSRDPERPGPYERARDSAGGILATTRPTTATTSATDARWNCASRSLSRRESSRVQSTSCSTTTTRGTSSRLVSSISRRWKAATRRRRTRAGLDRASTSGTAVCARRRGGSR